MRRLFLCVFILLLALDVRATELAGVTLPDSVQVGDTHLVLNGLGLRKKLVIKVYVAGLYLTQKASDPQAIIVSDKPKRVVLHFVRDVSKEQLTDAFDEAFTNNAPTARKSMKGEIDRFLGSLENVKEGDQMMFTYVPGKGTSFTLRGHDKLTIGGPTFAEVLFSVWLGPKPPNGDLKKGMLGQ